MTEEGEDVIAKINQAIEERDQITAQRDLITAHIHELVIQAIREGRHPKELPFSHAHIRRIAKEAGLPELRRGPAPGTKPKL